MDNDLWKKILDNLYDGVYFLDRDRRITYWNKGAERITGYGSSEVIGKHCWENILVHVNKKGVQLCNSLCPAKETITDGLPREDELYLHHKDGHRIPISVRVTPLRNEGGEVMGAVEIFNDISPRMTALQRISELEELAYLDALTGLANRRYIDLSLDARFNEMERYGWSFGTVLVDIDHFKDVNDRYGHDVGDRVLKMVSQTLLKSSRSFDIVGRWGGEEFLSIMPNVDREKLEVIANRFRFLVEHSILAADSKEVRVTVSVGATLAHPEDTSETLIKRVDQLMYSSKSSGRNCVSIDA
jgi:diguanylate cyclase (GGDEF)-like protein/PAS domain S-box-containing protein